MGLAEQPNKDTFPHHPGDDPVNTQIKMITYIKGTTVTVPAQMI